MNDISCQELGSQYRCNSRSISMLKNFFMAQQALSLELLEARPLGICKITTSTDITTSRNGIRYDLKKAKEML